MEIVHSKCCGIDVHNAVLAVCVRVVEKNGVIRKTHREFGTMYQDLLTLSDWLQSQGVTAVGMESTGVYWKPVFNVLRSSFEILVGNPQDMKRRRGDKTDKKDADWISELVAHGLLDPSFIPPAEIRALRDLTRARAQFVQSRNQAKNRVHKVLQECNIKLACVATDIFGKSGREMLNALVSGERDPKLLADMAKRRLRAKIPQLELALRGQFTEHHAMLIKLSLEQIDQLERQIAEIAQEIGKLLEPMQSEIDRMVTIPGVDVKAAMTIVAEIGVDMSRFASDKRLASWACICPGNNVSAGKHHGGKMRKGNKWLRRVLNQCAWAASKTDSFLGRTFRKLRARIGPKKAAMAVAHKILVIIYHILAEGTEYEESRYDRPSEAEEQRRRNKAVKTLEHLGYKVILEAVATS